MIAGIRGISLALLVTSVAGASAAAQNLVRNGNAEDGPRASENDVVPPPGWVTTGAFTALRYGVSGAPAAGAAGGANLFAGGPGAPVSTATQTVDVSASASAIDAGTAKATLSALLGGWESQGDEATVEALFVNGSQVVLGSVAVGPVSAADRGNRTTLLPRSKMQSVPPGTRRVRVLVTAERSAGNYNDGYADNVTLTLAAGAPARAHYRFGFRVFDGDIGLSAGRSGSFVTEGQPNAERGAAVVDVSAKPLHLAWTYRGRRYHANLRFTGKGTYGDGFAVLRLSLVTSNVAKCKPGSHAYVALRPAGHVIVHFCGRTTVFRAPERASLWIKPAA